MSEDLLFNMADTACTRAAYSNGWKEIYDHLMKLCKSREHQGWKRKTGMTQNHKILKHIQTQGSISQREALLDYSVQSLTKRISELREAGWNIHRDFHTHPITGQRYARYRLVA